MDREIVERLIKKTAAGNEDLEWLLEEIYREARDIIEKVGNHQTALVERKMVKAAGCLIRKKLTVEGLSRREYWESPEGRVTSQRLHDFVTARKRENPRVERL